MEDIDTDIQRLARQRASRPPYADYDELLQEGRLAVLEAQAAGEADKKNLLADAWRAMQRVARQDAVVRVPLTAMRAVSSARRKLQRWPEPEEVGGPLSLSTARSAIDAMKPPLPLPDHLEAEEAPEEDRAERWLASIPELAARAFELVELAGFTVAEAADDLQTTRSQVRDLLRQARRGLREAILEGEGG
jgi:RNA polymerase sigma factor (sigma-70 family)